jgi:hypothetical protein
VADVSTSIAHVDAVSARPESDVVPSHLNTYISVVVIVVSALLFYVFTTHGTFNPAYQQLGAGFADNFFYAQAQAMLHGHLNVAPSALPGECFVYHARCYGYFGLTPSILRVPFLPLLNDASNAYTPVFMTVALTLGVTFALAIAARILKDVRRGRLSAVLWAAIAVGIGPGSSLMMVARPAVYEEAIAWSIAFGLAAVYFFLRWWSEPRRAWAVLIVVCLTLSTNARPTTLPLAVLLGAGIAVRSFTHPDLSPRRLNAFLLAAVVAGLPVFAALGAWWLKFHVPVPSVLLDQQIGGPSPAPWWLAIRRLNHDHLEGVKFVPTALVAYLRPDDISLSSAFPFFNLRFGALAGTRYIGIPAGSMYIEPFSTITDDMPLGILMLIAGAGYAVHVLRSRSLKLGTHLRAVVGSPLTYCLLGTAAAAGVMLSSGWLTNRYAGDLFPFTALFIAVVARFLARPLLRLSGGAAIALGTAAMLVVTWSLLYDLGIEYWSWWSTAL